MNPSPLALSSIGSLWFQDRCPIIALFVRFLRPFGNCTFRGKVCARAKGDGGLDKGLRDG